MNTKSKIVLAAALIAVFSAPAFAQDNAHEAPISAVQSAVTSPTSAFAQANGARNIRQALPLTAAERAWIERATEGVSQY